MVPIVFRIPMRDTMIRNVPRVNIHGEEFLEYL